VCPAQRTVVAGGGAGNVRRNHDFEPVSQTTCGCGILRINNVGQGFSGMTSEIAVMNQRAVALSSDSAVTLIDGGTVVVPNDQRKLYILLGGQPVGIMFFGVADMMGHPWEHLIEHYQKKAKPGSLAHIRDYATGFTGMLDNLEEFFPKERQRDDYK